MQSKSQFFPEEDKRSVRTEEQEQSMANNDPSNNTCITAIDIQYKDIKINEVSKTNRISPEKIRLNQLLDTTK